MIHIFNIDFKNFKPFLIIIEIGIKDERKIYHTFNFNFKTWDHHSLHSWRFNNLYTPPSHFSHWCMFIASKPTFMICCVLTDIGLTMNVDSIVTLFESECLDTELEDFLGETMLFVGAILLATFWNREKVDSVINYVLYMQGTGTK